MGAANSFLILRKIRKNQWLKKSELDKIQLKNLRAMIKHAYKNTEFYHHKFKAAGIYPNDINSLDDFSKIPFTTKDELRKYSTSTFLAHGTNLNNCIIRETSGSTGIPTKVVYDEVANDFSKAVNLRSHIENGLKIRTKWAVFGDPHHFPKKKLFQHLNIYNPEYISIFDNIDKQIDDLKEINPELIGGYSSSIRLLADAVDKGNIQEINPKIVIGTSELLDKETRKYINSVFDVKMIDHYGCVELNRTAWECQEHSGYHMDIDSVVIEFIKEMENVSNGEKGEITYTGLYNYAMPLIRYKIGDIGIPSEDICPCGRSFPLIKSIEGRKDSFMITQDGRTFSPIIWTLIMRRIPGIKQFKAIQEKKNLVKILVVKNGNFSQNTVMNIESRVKEVMGSNLKVIVDIVESIPKDKSGKIRSVESKVKLKW